MAADLALLFINQFHQQPHNPSSWMWNSRTNSFQPRQTQEDNDSWEVRAFAEDTGNIMGSTWPPPSYTCTFCGREFRSAQALGGHMNVHRRDRTRLNQSPLQSRSPASSSSSPLLFPTPELVAGGAICLLYPFQAANTIGLNSPSTLVSISPSPPAINFPFSTGINTSSCRSVMVESTTVTADANGNSNNDESGSEELDLELRLGRRPSQH